MPSFKLAIATVTLGRVALGHTLPTKLEAAGQAGYDGVELTYECFSAYNTSLGRTDSLDDRLETAADVAKLASSFSLEIISLQPFMNFDALQDCSERLEVGKEWVQICAKLNARWLQIPSAVYPIPLDQATTDYEVIAANLRLLADYAFPYEVELAYEAPSWGVAAKSWQDIDKIINLVDRPNIRHNLDTFHIATYEMYDPMTVQPRPDGDERLKKSLEALEKLDPNKIAYVQLSDGAPVDLSQSSYPVTDPSLPPFCIWSRNARVHPYDGHLPVARIAQAFFDTGFEGWVSQESFHWDGDEGAPDRWAERGVESWQRLKKECGLAE
ncbi:hypothetical protein JCM8097_001810 [Rhodosporidiobolus ruineniae]